MNAAEEVSTVQSIGIASICTGGTQSRKQLDQKTVADIREDIRDSNPIAPIIVFFDGDRHWIGDGYHRLEAHVKEKRDIVLACVKHGSKDDALRFNIKSNASADQTRWTNADKRNAVTMLLQSYGYSEVSRKRAEEIMALAKCTREFIYNIAKEMRQASNPITGPTPMAQPAVAQVVLPKPIAGDRGDVREDEKLESKTTPKTTSPAGSRSVKMAERDEKIAAMAKDGDAAAEIARKLKVSASTVSDSLVRQRLTPDTANPLVKVLKRAQLAASEWEQIVSLLLDGKGTAASWPTATQEQKEEVIRHVKEAIRHQTDFIKRLNKEAKR